MNVTIDELKDYIFKYIAEYRHTYDKMTSSPPEGAGFPNIAISPFLSATDFDIYLAKDGIILSETGSEPDEQWYIAGGPALKVDTEPTSTPSKIKQIIKDNNLEGKPIGIYRIVAKHPIPKSIWRGRINDITSSNSYKDLAINVSLKIEKIESSVADLLCHLTFGAFGLILDIHLTDVCNSIGKPQIISKIGFFPADLNNKRFVNYMEIYNYSDRCGWDQRNIDLRVKNDIRRDFVKKLTAHDKDPGGSISSGQEDNWVENYTVKMGSLKIAINEFKNVLLFKSDDIEDTFHKLLEKYPILLDVYATKVESKPQFNYPCDQKSPIGKSYVEPDFIITYPDQSYKLIELERASKKIATKQGQPRAEFNQALFQTTEWVSYISENYSELKNKYPGINSKCRTCLIISRSTSLNFSGVEDIQRYKGMILQGSKVDEILTYDDLFEKALTAYTKLTGLSPLKI